MNIKFVEEPSLVHLKTVTRGSIVVGETSGGIACVFEVIGDPIGMASSPLPTTAKSARCVKNHVLCLRRDNKGAYPPPFLVRPCGDKLVRVVGRIKLDNANE